MFLMREPCVSVVSMSSINMDFCPGSVCSVMVTVVRCSSITSWASEQVCVCMITFSVGYKTCLSAIVASHKPACTRAPHPQLPTFFYPIVLSLGAWVVFIESASCGRLRNCSFCHFGLLCEQNCPVCVCVCKHGDMRSYTRNCGRVNWN